MPVLYCPKTKNKITCNADQIQLMLGAGFVRDLDAKPVEVAKPVEEPAPAPAATKSKSKAAKKAEVAKDTDEDLIG